jgi:uncharacterized alkaline shock family protein YloU
VSTPPAGAPIGAPTSAPVGAPTGGLAASTDSSDLLRAGATTDNTAALRAGARPEVADLIAAAVLALPGVAGLHAGAFGTVATYLPGRRVAGVAVRTNTSGQDAVEVSVVAALQRGLTTDLQALASRVHAVVAPLTPGPVTVTVADIADPAEAVETGGS